ncbi:MAG: uroporphyrinogen-III C-methyltransferase [Gammaproteobacteria bacterium]|nr:uroporphyrinogen-III C-methyltransferase [Gammaproteobacteria bacterium]
MNAADDPAATDPVPELQPDPATNPAPDPTSNPGTTAAPPAATTPTAPPPVGKPRRGAGRWFAFFVLFILIGTLAAGAFISWRWQVLQREAQTRLEALQREIAPLAPLADRMRALEAQNADLRQAMESGERRLAREVAALNRTVQSLDPESPLAERDFVLADTEYLVLAASQHLALEQDIGTALAAVAGADERLRSADHPDLLLVRERLAANIVALRGVAAPDTAGLALYLNGLQSQLATWPVRLAARGMPGIGAGTEPAASGWRGTLARLWQDLRGLVEIREVTPSDRLALDPVRQSLARETLRQELASARLAVLRRDSANLHASLTTTVALLEDYYDVTAPGVRDALDRLRALQGTELRPKLPDLGPTLDAIRALRSRTGDATPVTRLPEPTITGAPAPEPVAEEPAPAEPMTPQATDSAAPPGDDAPSTDAASTAL